VRSDTFSQRHGLLGGSAELVPRDQIPDHARRAIVQLALQHLKPAELRKHLFEVLIVLPAERPGMLESSVVAEIHEYVTHAEWYEIYDLVEEIHENLLLRGYAVPAADFKEKLNRYFVKHGVGWELVGGTLEVRNASLLNAESVLSALDEAKLSTAMLEIRAAIADLSYRPTADVTGAMRHAMGALECVARYTTQQNRLTLGEWLSRNRDVLPAPVVDAVSKLWGYASETARHVREGQMPSFETAELSVGIAAAVITYLVKQIPRVPNNPS
jgi:AbiJ-like protein